MTSAGTAVAVCRDGRWSSLLTRRECACRATLCGCYRRAHATLACLRVYLVVRNANAVRKVTQRILQRVHATLRGELNHLLLGLRVGLSKDGLPSRRKLGNNRLRVHALPLPDSVSNYIKGPVRYRFGILERVIR
jgi:hypothetical protein